MAQTRRRLRSGTVVLGGVGLLATALTACSSDPDKRCVDRDSYTLAKGYEVVADKNCKSSKSTSNGVWYYGGKKQGSWVDGGSLSKPGKGSGGSGGSSSSGGSGVDRGGFGGDGDGGSHKGSSGG
ncbi:hypothetical protein QFZ66_003492 [Streptomyces sp. B4I13]|uniref:Lipoprotein n=1 Tax=Streptomyces achromogenes TaxID=67255 RepID=A0ABU0Q589_STRAH|nr:MULTISPECIES: hypothetical protein [Streptomyces]MDQ0685835.1 hypothetical protein [Streptomyces achromogenes]MDQ0832982.1 hypothetical protein [Streptomyces achromogenes]MDQ0959614.1 hypothetical protein [Streptomyces sp. B4I13]